MEDFVVRYPDDPSATVWQKRIWKLCGSGKILNEKERFSLEGLFFYKGEWAFSYLESLVNKKYPYSPKNRNEYPGNWQTMRKERLQKAKNRCQKCKIENGTVNPQTGKLIRLVVAHLDHDPQNCAAKNLRVWCRSCHQLNDASLRRYYWQRRASDWWIKEGRTRAKWLGLWPKE